MPLIIKNRAAVPCRAPSTHVVALLGSVDERPVFLPGDVGLGVPFGRGAVHDGRLPHSHLHIAGLSTELLPQSYKANITESGDAGVRGKRLKIKPVNNLDNLG